MPRLLLYSMGLYNVLMTLSISNELNFDLLNFLSNLNCVIFCISMLDMDCHTSNDTFLKAISWHLYGDGTLNL